jgi:hypothetical protein
MEPTESARADGHVERMSPSTDNGSQSHKNSRYNKTWKPNVQGMPEHKMIALVILFRLLLSAMWAGPTALVAVAMRMEPRKGD